MSPRTSATSLTQTEARALREVLRSKVAMWLRTVVKESRLEHAAIEGALGRSAGYINYRTSLGSSGTISEDDATELARFLNVEIPPNIASAIAQLATLDLAKLAREAPPPRQELPDATTVESEMRALIVQGAANSPVSTRERERILMLRRFGVGSDHAASLAELAKDFGITRQRVQHCESRALTRIVRMLHGRSAPLLSEVHRRMLSVVGATYEGARLLVAETLGEVPLREALRFHAALHPEATRLDLRRRIVHVVGHPAQPKRPLTIPRSHARHRVLCAASQSLLACLERETTRHRLSADEVKLVLAQLSPAAPLPDTRLFADCP